MKRIAFCRISHETNALSPVFTTIDDFRARHYLEGKALLKACGRWAHEAPGMIRNAELSGFVKAARKHPDVDIIPLFSAWDVPGGRITRATFDYFAAELERQLRAAGPLDGLYLSMHGAMCGEGVKDPEALLLAIARDVVGPDAIIGVSFDLHAHLTKEKVAPVDIVTAYRTNPHRDHAKVGFRTGDLIIRAVKKQIKPVISWRTLPMVLGGGTTLDFLPTMRPLFRRMTQMEKDDRVLYASLFMCQLWHEAADLGWATCVVTDASPAIGDRLAEELAIASWDVRHKLPPKLPDPLTAIKEARSARWQRRLGTVCMSDASDMVGAGAPGESTQLLRALLEHASDMKIYATVRDAETLQALWLEALDAEVSTTVGGRYDPEANRPVQVSGRVAFKHPDTPLGRALLLDLGHVQLVITEGPPLAMKPDYYRMMGLRIRDADVCMVKSLFPFRLYFLLLNRKTIYTRTSGTTDFDAWRHQTYDGPVHPKDEVDSWRPADNRRRVAFI